MFFIVENSGSGHLT